MPIYSRDAMRRIDNTVLRVEDSADDISGVNPYDRAAPSERPASFRNDSGGEIPAYACMKLASGAKYSSGPPVPFFIASKPGATLLTDRFALNGPNPVASGDHGICYLSGQTKALYNTGTPVAGDAYGPTPGQWYLTKDYPPIFRVAVVSDATPKHFYGELHPIELLRGELKDDMPDPDTGSVAAGQTATAYFLDKDGDIVTAIEFEVTDVFGVYRGRENGKYSTPHDRGSQLYAKFNPDSDVWEIVKMTPHALQIKGALTAAVTSPTDFTIDGVTVMQPSGSIITDTDPASAVFDVTNRLFDGDNNAVCIATWDEAAVDWVALDVPCPA